jgi:hypothetical protein
MARRVKPKIQYKKNKQVPKAFIGSVINYFKGRKQRKMGEQKLEEGEKAMKDFDQSRLESRRSVSKATKQVADQPIDQSYIEKMEDARLKSEAGAMKILSRDPRRALAGITRLQGQARQQELGLLGEQQKAKTAAMQNLAREQESVQKDIESQRLDVAGQELAGIKGQMAAGEQTMWGGMEEQYSSAAAFGDEIEGAAKDAAKALINPASALTGGGSAAETSSADNWLANNPNLSYQGAKEGGKITKDGGVTPGEFSHSSNPIDMVQDGEKVGEATGGELILPPDDVEEIRMALQGEDKDDAFELMKRLVDKYDSNAIGDSENKADMGASIPKDKVSKIMRYVMRKDMDGSLLSENYAEVAREELNLTDKEVDFLESYAKSRKS